MEGKVRKVDRQTRKKYERRARRRNRRHPIEHIVELIILAIVLVVVISVTMHNCSKQNNLNETKSTEESTIENGVNHTEQQTPTDVEETTAIETEEQTKESETELSTTEQEIPTTSSVWDDPFETVDSWVNNFEKEYIQQIIDEWEAKRYFFNLTMGSLDMLLEESSVTQFTEEMNKIQQQYIMSNIVIEPDNVITEGTFTEKYETYQALMTSMKENLSGVSVSRRFVANDYIGYKAPLQNALGLVPANYEEAADNLKHLNITLNIIPENTEPQEEWIEYIEALHEYGIAAGMYFPYDGFEYATMQDLKEMYQPIFDAGVDYIVMSEKVFPFITGNEPATFSKRFIQKIRDEFGFKGVIVTADMSSDEIQQYIVEQQIEHPMIYAFLQGCDMVYVNENYGSTYFALNKLYKDGTITDERLKVSMQRILNKAYLYTCGE